ncbi:hypothetical protein HPC49_12910 [Pyxidicoccus fallax]|uniref:Uncharacterized protein n=1 Tax=Pyxidicoccus fallax TaxID=394095 RepID=A0A848LLK0_9BACT|nr:hypothetical protein [Pyxidicoccus fallax]NMO18685.1 hypothetical protein [Pyxidicoccus fallax]NPC79136.1 hypothetical protein [Pyxidicoccus fallax]
MTVQYDANIIRDHAAALYSRAARIVFMTGFLGCVIGAIVGAALGAPTGGKPGIFLLLGAVFGALVGVSIGRGRAFVLQLQAQTALCQVAIEANTRRAADAAGEAIRPAASGHLSQVG